VRNALLWRPVETDSTLTADTLDASFLRLWIGSNPFPYQLW